MLSGTIDILLALILVIPVHGIYLSLFFFIHSKRHLNANFLMGLLLLMVSCLSFFQNFCSPSSVPDLVEYRCGICHDLLLCPLVYLYTRAVIYPDAKDRFLKHFMSIILILLLFFISSCLNDLIYVVTVPVVTIMGGQYLGGSFSLIIEAIRKTSAGYRGLLISQYSAIIILNLLISGTILASIINFWICPANAIYFIQLARALIIYYTYYRILAIRDQKS